MNLCGPSVPGLIIYKYVTHTNPLWLYHKTLFSVYRLVIGHRENRQPAGVCTRGGRAGQQRSIENDCVTRPRKNNNNNNENSTAHRAKSRTV